MKKIAFFVLGVIPMMSFLGAYEAPGVDLAYQIPEIQPLEYRDYQLVPNVAQYKMADWSGVVGIARNISRDQAMKIAYDNPEISFFFYTKGYQMVLETEQGDYRIFHHGDTVFFKGEPWWGTAPGLADGYMKRK